MSGKISVSKNGKLYFRRTVRNGKVQKAFGAQIGKPVGSCVARKVKDGMSGSEIRNIVKDCSKEYKGKELSF